MLNLSLALKKYKLVLLAMALFGMVVLVSLSLPVHVFADARTDACNAIGGNSGGGGCSTGGPTVGGTLEAVINTLSIIIGAIAVIMIILGGFRYITSAGDSNKTKGARDTIIYAVVGLIVVSLAQAIVKFVLQKV